MGSASTSVKTDIMAEDRWFFTAMEEDSFFFAMSPIRL